MNTKYILKTLIILTFLYSRYTFYADAYPKLAHDGLLENVVSYLKSSADFIKAFSSNIKFPPEKTTIQKVEDYLMNIPAISTFITDARKVYKENFQSHFLTEVYTRIFSQSDRLHLSQHFSMRWFIYDSIILCCLMYALYFDSTIANLFLFGDALYKMCLLTLYHFRENPLERLSNYFLSFFTNMKTFDILAMFKTNWGILVDHRSVIATFFYACLLGGFIYLYGGKINIPSFDKLKEEFQHREPTKITDKRETMRH
jgi:hypothetical protein